MEYISPEGLRQDGRRPVELRQLTCKIDVLSKADGSAMLEMGNTKVCHMLNMYAILSAGNVPCPVYLSMMVQNFHIVCYSCVAIAICCCYQNAIMNFLV